MQINQNCDTPIFLQIAQQIEDAIFTGIFMEETQIPSTTELSLTLNINPHTVLKGMNLLVRTNILYKKRGVGMFVSKGAYETIRKKRQEQFYDRYIFQLITEAKKLDMTKKDILLLIERGFDNERD